MHDPEVHGPVRGGSIVHEWRCPHGVLIGQRRDNGSIWVGNRCLKCRWALRQC